MLFVTVLADIQKLPETIRTALVSEVLIYVRTISDSMEFILQ